VTRRLKTHTTEVPWLLAGFFEILQGIQNNKHMNWTQVGLLSKFQNEFCFMSKYTKSYPNPFPSSGADSKRRTETMQRNPWYCITIYKLTRIAIEKVWHGVCELLRHEKRILQRVTNGCVINNKYYRGIHRIRNEKTLRTEWWGVSP